MSNRDFALWAACHRIYNQMPTLVSDERDATGGGQVRFMMTLHGADGESLESVYDEDRILALGYEDEDTSVHLMAVEEDFMGVPCIVFVRTAASYVDSTAVAEVTVFLEHYAESQHAAIAQVRDASRPDYFENYLEERQQEMMRESPDSVENKQGRSLLERWFGK